MSVEWPEYVGYSSVLLHRDFEAMARILTSDSDMNVQATGVASRDSECRAAGTTNLNCHSAD